MNKQKTPITPETYKQVRKGLKLTQRQLADTLKVDLRTVQRRELGQMKIPYEAGLALDYLVAIATALLANDPALAKKFAAIGSAAIK